MPEARISDRGIKQIVSVVLRSGVILSGTVELLGGLLLLASHGTDRVDYQIFEGQPASERSVSQILGGVLSFQPRSVIQFGILLLLATPVARVAVSLAGFVLERDRAYIVITALVLLILLYSIIGGAVGAT